MKFSPSLAGALALVALIFGGGAAKAQTAFYTANTTTATPEAGSVHFLQVVNLAQGAGVYSLSSIAVGINFTSAAPENIVFKFYSGVDTSATATNALATATELGNTSPNDNPPGAGNYAFTYSFSTPITLTLNGTAALGVELDLVDANGNYATDQNGRFTASAPTVGTSSGVVFNDANLDNVFTGSEQTTFGMANANIRLSLSGTYAVPEPSTWALLVAGAVGVGVALRRRTTRVWTR